jgi:hypothetical protein
VQVSYELLVGTRAGLLSIPRDRCKWIRAREALGKISSDAISKSVVLRISHEKGKRGRLKGVLREDDGHQSRLTGKGR